MKNNLVTTFRELDTVYVVDSWYNAEGDLPCPSLSNYSFFAVNRKTSKNNRNYGGVIISFCQTSFSSAI